MTSNVRISISSRSPASAAAMILNRHSPAIIVFVPSSTTPVRGGIANRPRRDAVSDTSVTMKTSPEAGFFQGLMGSPTAEERRSCRSEILGMKAPPSSVHSFAFSPPQPKQRLSAPRVHQRKETLSAVCRFIGMPRDQTCSSKDPVHLREKAARCLSTATSLPPGPDGDQLRLFAQEFAEMAAKMEAPDSTAHPARWYGSRRRARR